MVNKLLVLPVLATVPLVVISPVVLPNKEAIPHLIATL
jgi:hypothetical protein